MTDINWWEEIEALKADCKRYQEKQGFFNLAANVWFIGDKSSDKRDLFNHFKANPDDRIMVCAFIQLDLPLIVTNNGVGVCYEQSGHVIYKLIEWGKVHRIEAEYSAEGKQKNIVVISSTEPFTLPVTYHISEAIVAFINKVAESLGDINIRKEQLIAAINADIEETESNPAVMLKNVEELLSIEENPHFVGWKGEVLLKMKRLAEAAQVFTKCIAMIDSGEWTNNEYPIRLACEYLGDVSEEMKDYATARIAYQRAYETSDDSAFKVKMVNQIQALSLVYSNAFLSEPYHKRQKIVISKNLPNKVPRSFQCLTLEECQNEHWHWQTQPVENMVYIAHPKIVGKYYPLSVFHDKMIEEKYAELIRLMAALGATQIDITYEKGEEAGRNVQSSVATKIEIEAFVDVNAATKETNATDSKRKTAHALKSRFTFNPKKSAYIPDGLLWFEYEPMWKQIADNRINGGILTANVEFKYNDDQQINEATVSDISGELKYLDMRVAGSFLESIDKKSYSKQDILWKLEVTFTKDILAPVASVISQETKTPSINKDGEEGIDAEYGDFVKMAITDGDIPANKRKMLEKKRIALGISKERACEIEQLVMRTSALSDPEMEFYADLEYALKQGILSDGVNMMLERRRNKLNISESRAEEIRDILEAKGDK